MERTSHLNGEAGWQLIYEIQPDDQPAESPSPLKLRPGDYVLTRDLRDEAHYREVGGAFMRAGAPAGEFPYYDEIFTDSCFGWCRTDGLYHTVDRGVGGITPDEGERRRRLTPEQVIAAAPAVTDAPDTEPEAAAPYTRSERAAWDRFVAVTLQAPGRSPWDAATIADRLLRLRRERFHHLATRGAQRPNREWFANTPKSGILRA